ncbi:MAG: N-acetylmuramic acid 6-phosphate etherase [Acidobacteriota bacterium]
MTSTQRYVVGIDAGGSKTLAALADGQGRVLRTARGPGANLVVHGEEAAAAALEEVLGALEAPQIDALCLGMAGAGRAGDAHVAQTILARLGVRCPLRVVPDAFVALVAGAPERQGIVVVSGTGSLAWGADGAGAEARSGGWGHLLGDEGSAYWLGHAAVRRGIRAADGRGPETQLGPRILDRLELDRPQDLVAWFYDQESSRSRVAALAPVVEEASEAGDEGARELLDEAALHLSRAARSVETKLNFSGSVPLVLAGGAFRACPSLAERLHRALGPGPFEPRPWVEDPVEGAVALALDLLETGRESTLVPPAALSEASSSRWAALETEQQHAKARDLDLLSTVDLVTLLINEDRAGLQAALAQRAEIARLAGWLAEAHEAGGDLILVGAGTSGRLGILEAAECPPTFGTDPQRVRAFMAGGSEAVFEAVEGAEDNRDAGTEVGRAVRSVDLIVGISASSVTPYALAALAAASVQGARTALITCASRSGLEESADLVLALGTGPEVLTGSTRLKAGSATKAVLNAVTTAAMVRTGKVYGSWMVDLRRGSAKLRDRAERIVAVAAGWDAAAAREVLRDCDGDVKLAIVRARTGVSAARAGAALEAAGGHVRAALGELGDDV